MSLQKTSKEKRKVTDLNELREELLARKKRKPNGKTENNILLQGSDSVHFEDPASQYPIFNPYKLSQMFDSDLMNSHIHQELSNIKKAINEIRSSVIQINESYSQALPGLYGIEGDNMSDEIREMRDKIHALDNKLTATDVLVKEMNTKLDKISSKLDTVPTKLEMTQIILEVSRTLKFATEEHVANSTQMTKTNIEEVKTSVAKTHTKIMAWSIGTGIAVIAAIAAIIRIFK